MLLRSLACTENIRTVDGIKGNVQHLSVRCKWIPGISDGRALGIDVPITSRGFSESIEADAATELLLNFSSSR